MKWITLIFAGLLAPFAAAQNFPLITSNPDAGVQPVLLQLHQMHGQYQVRGRMRDGTACIVNVITQPREFKIEIYDNRPNVLLEELIIKPQVRMLAFELRDNPDKRTSLALRDRVVYPKGSGTREVDLILNIEETNDGGKVYVSYEDRIKRRRYFCAGEKSEF